MTLFWLNTIFSLGLTFCGLKLYDLHVLAPSQWWLILLDMPLILSLIPKYIWFPWNVSVFWKLIDLTKLIMILFFDHKTCLTFFFFNIVTGSTLLWCRGAKRCRVISSSRFLQPQCWSSLFVVHKQLTRLALRLKSGQKLVGFLSNLCLNSEMELFINYRVVDLSVKSYTNNNVRQCS